MDTLTLKIPNSIKEKLNSYSKRKGLNKSEVVRNALSEFLSKDEEKQGTFYDLAKDLAGSVNGESDLSTNKIHFSEYGK